MGGISIPSASARTRTSWTASPQIGSLLTFEKPTRIDPSLAVASCRQSPKPVVLIVGIASSGLKMIAPGENGPPQPWHTRHVLFWRTIQNKTANSYVIEIAMLF